MLLTFTTLSLLLAAAEALKLPLVIGENYTAKRKGKITKALGRTMQVTNDDDTNMYSELSEEIQRKILLKPKELNAEDYSFLSLRQKPMIGTNKDIPLTAIKSAKAKGHEFLEVTFEDNATFVGDLDDLTHYLVDFGDGQRIARCKLEAGVMGTLSLKIKQAHDQPPIRNISDRLANLQVKEIYIGGPYVQIVHPKFLQWSVFEFDCKKVDNDGTLSITIPGKIRSRREKYWIKENNTTNALHPGTLVEKDNGAGEFHIDFERDSPQAIESNIKKYVCRSGKYLFGSVFSISSSATVDAIFPDRKIFDITEVKINGKSVVIKFNWLENQDGHSFSHIVEVEWGKEAYLLGKIYFDKNASSGTVIAYHTAEGKTREDASTIMQVIHSAFLFEKLKPKTTLKVSGPCNMVDVKMSGHYSTPLTLTLLGEPILRNSYYLEFKFTSYV